MKGNDIINNCITCNKDYPVKFKFNNYYNCLENNKKSDSKDITKEGEIKYYDIVLDEIEDIFTSGNYDTNNLDEGKDDVIETEKITITLTTTDNQKNNVNEKKTSIDLGECETSLRKHYNISDDEKLYIQKIDIVQEGMKIPKIEYSVYAKISGNNLVKLNISVYISLSKY